jgi:RHS repeat-associated protein
MCFRLSIPGELPVLLASNLKHGHARLEHVGTTNGSSFADITPQQTIPALSGSASLVDVTYHFNDHLGNVRLSYTTVCGPPHYHETMFLNNIREYFPFGTTLREWLPWDERYAFQGQEHDKETGCDYFRYRMYDPEVARFNSVDPLREKYPHNSPFAFSENRVVDGVELEGLEVALFHGDARVSALATGSVSTGIAVDVNSNFGVFTTFGIGVGYIGGYSLGGGVTFIDAPHLDKVKGWGFSVLASGVIGEGLSVSFNGSVQTSSENWPTFIGASLQGSVGLEAGAAIEGTYTTMAHTSLEKLRGVLIAEGELERVVSQITMTLNVMQGFESNTFINRDFRDSITSSHVYIEFKSLLNEALIILNTEEEIHK